MGETTPATEAVRTGLISFRRGYVPGDLTPLETNAENG